MLLAKITRLAPALGVLLAPAGVAAEPAGHVRVAFEVTGAVDGCPPESEFVQWVRERLAKAELAQEEPGAREYRVAVRNVGTRFVARLEFADTTSTTRTRELAAETCADASRAIALVTALAIDADGATGDEAGGADGPITASEALGLVPSAVPAGPSTTELTPNVPEANRQNPPESPSPGVPPEVELGVRATLSTPKGPSVMPGAEIFAAVRDAGALFIVELGIVGERGLRTDSGPGSVQFSFAGVRLGGCVPSLQLGGGFGLWPCVSLEGGALLAKGYIDNPATRVDPWVDAAVAARLEYRAGAGRLRLDVGPIFPITRNRYIFENPVETAHQVPRVGLLVALGGALRIF